MQWFEALSEGGHEQLLLASNPEVGLTAIVAIHNTALGPALGGCRLLDYPTEEMALQEVLSLARHMTYKAAMAGLDLGGGAAVIVGDPSVKTEAMFRAFGRHVASMGGRFIAAEDTNTTVADMDAIRRETRWVVGTGAGLGGSGDPAPYTAWGIFHGMRATMEVVYGTPTLQGRTVAIQGLGNVGFRLARHLHEAGASLIFADFNEKRVEEARAAFGGRAVSPEEIFGVECDILAPCAVGGLLSPHTIPSIRARVVAGAANQLLECDERDAAQLQAQGVLYVPDYVINAGGLISVSGELRGWSREKSMADAAAIFERAKQVLNRARLQRITTYEAANRIAEERMAVVSRLQRLRLPQERARR